MVNLRVERKDLEKYLQQLHTDNQRHVDLMLPTDIPPIGEIGSPMDDGPLRWREVQEVVCCVRAALRLLF